MSLNISASNTYHSGLAELGANRTDCRQTIATGKVGDLYQ